MQTSSDASVLHPLRVDATFSVPSPAQSAQSASAQTQFFTPTSSAPPTRDPSTEPTYEYVTSRASLHGGTIRRAPSDIDLSGDRYNRRSRSSSVQPLPQRRSRDVRGPEVIKRLNKWKEGALTESSAKSLRHVELINLCYQLNIAHDSTMSKDTLIASLLASVRLFLI